MQGISYMCTYTSPSGFPQPHHTRSSQSTKPHSLCYPAGSHWVSVLHMRVIYVNPNLPVHPTLPFKFSFSEATHFSRKRKQLKKPETNTMLKCPELSLGFQLPQLGQPVPCTLNKPQKKKKKKGIVVYYFEKCAPV